MNGEVRKNPSRELAESAEEVFPAEVIELHRRGVPLPTWFAGPLYPKDGYEIAQREFAEYREREKAGGDAEVEE